MLELLVSSVPLSSLLSSVLPLQQSAVCSHSQTSTLLVCPVNVLPFLG